MAGVARWCVRHSWTVVGIWLVALIALGAVDRAVGSAYSDNFNLPGTESTKALDLLQSAFPNQAGEADTIVWHVKSGKVTDSAVQQPITAMLDKVAHAPSVRGVTSPYSPTGITQISRDGQTAYATIQWPGFGAQIPAASVKNVIALADGARTPQTQVELGGQAIQQVNQVSTSLSEGVGIIGAAIVLLLAFGSFFAMLLPLLAAVFSLLLGSSAISLLSHGMAINNLSPVFAILVGLGVGVDYALFIVTRHRNGLKAGLDVEESIVRALNTSGRAVLFAGATVCIAMLGLLVLRVDFLSGLGVPSALMVLLTVLAAVTLLPALLALRIRSKDIFRMRVLSRRERRRLATEGPYDEHAVGGWARWSGFVSRHPKTLAAGAFAVIVVLAIPFFSLRLGTGDQGNDPKGSTTRNAYELLANGFGPGFNGPLQLVATVPTPSDAQAFAQLTATVKATPGVATAVAAPIKPGQHLGVMQVIPTTSPQDKGTTDLIKTLRSEVIPKAEGGTTMRVYVGGLTAIFNDFSHVLSSKLPLFLGVIVVLGCVLLLIAFRSIVVPLTAAVMNLLAAGASFGVVVAFFQFGWGSDAIGLGRAGPIDAFVPVLTLAVLFGLSMDYQVFLVSRMHEEWVHTRRNRAAVITGQSSTGRVITAAATIMILVFLAFVFGGQRVVAEFGIGLASAVFIDAFVLRTVLVPALMHMFGAANWWLPRWIDRWLPHLSVEPPEDAAEIDALDDPVGAER
jgi:putative drug exporter of the RND superfamily